MNRLPPGPSRIGLVDFLQQALISPVPLLARLTRQYGPTFRVVTRSARMTLTGDPEMIRAVYSADPDSFDVAGVDVTEPVFGLTSLPVSTGARHRRDRKLLTPPFNSSAMRSYGTAIAEVTRDAVARWTRGLPFDVLDTTQEITLDVIIRVVFGVEGKERVARTREAVLGLIDSLSPLLLFFPRIRRDFGGFGPWAKNRRARAVLDRLLAEEIERRRAAVDGRKDILSLMMRARYDDGSAMPDEELIDQLRAVLFAGHETTAVALAWALDRLHREPAALERVLAEIDALGAEPDPDALAGLPFLDAVCQETLRMYPPVVDPARIAKAPFDLGPYTIPAGEGIRPSPLILHGREDIYPEPSKFNPSRFLDRKLSPFEYNPFGGGARRCLGAAFAMYEMKVVLGTLLRACRLRVASHAPPTPVRRGATLGPRGGVPMLLIEKRAARAS